MATPSARIVQNSAQTIESQQLARLADRARKTSSASGAAIALREGNTAELVCFARSGSIAPDVGSILSVEATFVGLCFQTAKQLCCDDTEADKRAGLAALNAIGIRSLAVTPIHLNREVMGILAVFVDTPRAFSSANLSRLNAIARQIATLPPEKLGAQSAQPGSQLLVARPGIKPDVNRPLPPASAHILFRDEDAEPRYPAQPATRSSALHDLAGALDVAARQPDKRRTSFMVTGVAAILMIATSLVWSFLKMRELAAVEPVRSRQPVNNAPAVEMPGDRTVAPAAGFPQTSARTPLDGPDGMTGQHGESSGRERQAVSPSRPSSRFERSAIQPSIEIASAHLRGKTTSHRVADAAARSSASSTSSVPANSPSKASKSLNRGLPIEPPNPATPPAPISLQFVPAQLVHIVAPVYPPDANPSLTTDSVVVRFTVGKDGGVMNPEFLKGLPAFKRAALDAVGQWQYTPALNNGKPVEQQIEVSLDFNPSTRSPAPANSNELADVNARQPIATQAGFVPAQLMSSVRPAYPALARQWLTTGTVVVRVKVDKDGRVVDPEVLRGPILFRRAALDAVKRWQYRPATANGQPIEQQVEVRLDFRPQ